MTKARGGQKPHDESNRRGRDPDCDIRVTQGSAPAAHRACDKDVREFEPDATSVCVCLGSGLLLTFEDPADRPHETFDQRTRSPLVDRDHVARGEIALEVLTEAAGDRRVAHRHVHFVVVLE